MGQWWLWNGSGKPWHLSPLWAQLLSPGQNLPFPSCYRASVGHGCKVTDGLGDPNCWPPPLTLFACSVSQKYVWVKINKLNISAPDQAVICSDHTLLSQHILISSYWFSLTSGAQTSQPMKQPFLFQGLPWLGSPSLPTQIGRVVILTFGSQFTFWGNGEQMKALNVALGK